MSKDAKSDGAVLYRHYTPGEKFGEYQVLGCVAYGCVGALYHLEAIVGGEERWFYALHAAVPAGVRPPELPEHAALLPLGAECAVAGVRGFEVAALRGWHLADYVRERLQAPALPEGMRPEGALPPPEVGQPSGLSLEEVRGVLEQVAQGLGALHERGLTHLDVTPQNVVVLRDGGVRLVGAGWLAQVEDPLHTELRAARPPVLPAGVVVGGFHGGDVLPPEARGGRQVAAAGDLYALGVLAYWLLTQRLPGVALTPVSALNGSAGSAWDALVNRCLSPDPQGRYAGVKPFLADLAKTGEGRRLSVAAKLAAPEGSEGGTAGTTGPVVAPARRRSRVWGLAVAAGLVIVALGAWWLLGSGETPAASQGSGPEGVVAAPQWADFVVLGPEGAKVRAWVNGRAVELGTVGAQGRLSVRSRVPAGVFDLEMTLEGYEPWRQDGIAQAAGVSGAEYGGPLTPEAARVALPGLPEGTEVWLDGVRVGVAPLEVLRVPPAVEQVLSLRLSGHREQVFRVLFEAGEVAEVVAEPFVAEAGVVAVQVTLESRAPSDAEREALRFFVGDREFAGTLNVLEGIAPGVYSVRAEHPDFFPVTHEVYVGDGGRVPASFNLRPRPARLRVSTGEGVPLELFADGVLQRADAEGAYVFESGKLWNLEVRAVNYLVVRNAVRFAPNQQSEWEVRLVRIGGPQPDQPWQVPYLGLEMVWVPQGEFRMGSPRDEAGRDWSESPITFVEIRQGLWVGTYEVTQQQYVALMETHQSRFRAPDRPVENVSWQDAVKFCEILTQREREAGRLPEGYVYRLPTEAEWEYACRAGTETPFSFGAVAEGSEGNFKGRYPRVVGEVPGGGVATVVSGEAGTSRIGAYAPNAWGLCDMHGNVAEWVRDWASARLPGGRVADPVGPASGDKRFARGGSWDGLADAARSAARGVPLDGGARSHAIGFRVVLASELP